MNVLLGISGTDDVESLVSQAVERAREAGDDLTVAVVEVDDAGTDVEKTETRARSALADAGFDAEVHVLDGHPGSRLVEFADADGFDRLVIGGGTRSPLGKIQLGSTAEFVLLNARVTVTLLR
jgi:nucleotide-binding universal stress UspA family protein